ncbi:MAG TPA: GAF domain-containing protein [Bacteroidia bacterium]
MSEEIIINGETKEEKYISLLPQVTSLVKGEEDMIANLANITAAIKQTFGFYWVGFYLVKNNELVLGPFQGTLACTRIAFGKGVCGTAWKEAKTILVDDVDKFLGHIACSSASKSEIVVPIFNHQNEVIAVLDIDEDKYSAFDETDKFHLEKIATLVTSIISK